MQPRRVGGSADRAVPGADAHADAGPSGPAGGPGATPGGCDRLRRGGAYPGGERPPAAAGRCVRIGHGAADGLPRTGSGEPVPGRRGAEPARGETLPRPAEADRDRVDPWFVRPGRRGGRTGHRGADRQASARAAGPGRRRRRGQLLRRRSSRPPPGVRSAGADRRRQGHPDAAGGVTGGHRQGRGRQQAQAGYPALTRREDRPQTHGRTRLRLRRHPVPRTPADIIARPGSRSDLKRRRGPVAEGKWLTASVTDDIPLVIADVFDEATRRDPGHQRTWVALVDGNRTQIEAIKAEAARRQVTVHIVVDFIHALEYIWKAAWSFFDPGDPAAEDWVADQAVKLLSGKARDVAAGIRRRATRYGYSTAERKGADEAGAYLTSKTPYLRYDHALQAGWPIATGTIEGACRHLVKDRLEVTGARWGLTGAEAILTLRALVANGDFNAYWAHHLKQEHQRVHLSRYQQDYTLTA